MRLLGFLSTYFGAVWAHHPRECHGNGLPKSQGTWNRGITAHWSTRATIAKLDVAKLEGVVLDLSDNLQ
jgi:hypothetical protein